MARDNKEEKRKRGNKVGRIKNCSKLGYKHGSYNEVLLCNSVG